MRKENGKMNHWKSANFGSDKHAKLSPPQFFADGGRAGSDGKWWKIVCMYGAHVRSDQSLVNGSHFDCVGHERQPISEFSQPV